MLALVLKKLLDVFSSEVTINLLENRIQILDNNSSLLYDDVPILAFKTHKNGDMEMVEIGKNAIMQTAFDVSISRPFSHPRIIVDDFEKASIILRYAIEKGLGRKGFFSPKVLLKVSKKFDTELTQVEKQVLEELVLNIGAREVTIQY